jgi:hypothetical protein
MRCQPECMPHMQEMCVRNAKGVPKSDPIPMLRGTPYSGRTGLTMCDVLHPERNGPAACDVHFLDALPVLFRRSIGVYIPVYAASTVAVQRAQVLRKPLHFAGKMLSGALRSAVFLTTYVALAHRGACPGGFPVTPLPARSARSVLTSQTVDIALLCYKLKGKKKGKNPNCKEATKAIVNRNHSNSTTASSRRYSPSSLLPFESVKAICLVASVPRRATQQEQAQRAMWVC